MGRSKSLEIQRLDAKVLLCRAVDVMKHDTGGSLVPHFGRSQPRVGWAVSAVCRHGRIQRRNGYLEAACLM